MKPEAAQQCSCAEQCAHLQGAMKQGITEHVRVKKVHEKTGVGAVPPPSPSARPASLPVWLSDMSHEESTPGILS